MADTKDIISTIVVGNPHDTRAYVQSMLATYTIAPLDTTILRIDSDSAKSTSIGVADIRDMQKTIYLKPISSPYKAAIIEDFQRLTPDSQNALLKILEEPPAQTCIILTGQQKEGLLPTVLSRCKLIELPKTNHPKQANESGYHAVLTRSKGEKLMLAQEKGKTKEDALDWLFGLITSLHEQGDNHRIVAHLKQAHTTYMTIKSTNISPRFALEVFLLSLEE